MAANFQRRLAQAREFLLSNRFDRALILYQQLATQRPNDAVLWFEYGNAACGVNQIELAEKAWNRCLAAAPTNAELIGLIGHQYQNLRRPQRALECFAKAAAADPRDINSRISLAVLAEQNHRLHEAREAVQRCLAIDPKDDQARYFQAVLDRRENNLILAEQRLRDLLASDPRQPFVRYAARYELANILDRTGRCSEAVSQLLEAKKIVAALTDTQQLIRGYDQGAEAARTFTRGLPANVLETWARDFPLERRELIPRLAFLGGHPRSGTTLLEQVLDANPDVAALDEHPAFLKLLQPEFHRSKDLSPGRLNTLRQLYLRAVLSELGGDAMGKVIVDKNPSPTARLPLWLKVFPELRVMIALRDPRDVVLSCFFQNIPLNAVNVNFLSLERVAKHYADLMDIWLTVRNWEGFEWLETRYEDLVTNLEAEGRRVAQFLGVSWNEKQSHFFEASRQKQLYSPTYQDVTRPIYSRSVGRWHAYESFLQPILPKLEQYVRMFGYG